jgi:mRNA-degrading endonuclease RelE of RelBE toxin-antitoxin system
MYTLFFEPSAFRIFKKLPKAVKDHLISEAEILKTEPLSGKPLIGGSGFRSLRTGYKGTEYRIIYQVIETTETIIIRLADKRENIYKRLQKRGS